ncbi:hypothetical protein EVAR_62728_1 [Eumeta japonica]|uniref:Uncharacterized protein n=1 Tax=Eumeta variegata TaxID=151549 RepID=A0A4C1ZCR0_EUMVA|nr:hypothetical protein EVAR_62728_1 [Eumeta japonica]
MEEKNRCIDQCRRSVFRACRVSNGASASRVPLALSVAPMPIQHCTIQSLAVRRVMSSNICYVISPFVKQKQFINYEIPTADPSPPPPHGINLQFNLALKGGPVSRPRAPGVTTHPDPSAYINERDA